MISAVQLPLGQFFPNNYFTIPGFQRPYVWDKDEIETLLEDLENAKNLGLQDYFIGNVVFYTNFQNNFNTSIILDGQQRLTTILLLFAVIRDRLGMPQIQTLLEYDLNGIQRDKIDFDIRKNVTSFIKNHVIPLGGTKLPVGMTLSDKSAINMANALQIMHNWFDNNPSSNPSILYQYLLQNVFIVSVASQNMQDALRLFTVLNNRGVKLRSSDILKADNLSAIAPAKQNEFATNWENIENDFDEEGFDLFLLHLRTILVKTKAQKNLLDEYKDIYHNGVLQLGLPTIEFIRKYKQHYDDIQRNDYIKGDLRLYNTVQILSKTVKSNIWLPVLLFYKEKFCSQNLIDFALLLEKKFSADWLNGMSLTPRITAMNDILKAIDSSSTPAALFSNTALDYNKHFINNLTISDLYGTPFASYILGKLCFLLGDPVTTKLTFKGTIEHILPQNPQLNSQWCMDFTSQEIIDWKHKLGNLVLLDRAKNTSLSNNDYTVKKTKYFGSHINLYPLSLKILTSYQNWTQLELSTNHQNMIDVLDKHY